MNGRQAEYPTKQHYVEDVPLHFEGASLLCSAVLWGIKKWGWGRGGRNRHAWSRVSLKFLLVFLAFLLFSPIVKGLHDLCNWLTRQTTWIRVGTALWRRRLAMLFLWQCRKSVADWSIQSLVFPPVDQLVCECNQHLMPVWQLHKNSDNNHNGDNDRNEPRLAALCKP